MDREKKRGSLKIPAWLKSGPGAGTSPVYFIDTRGGSLDSAAGGTIRKTGEKLCFALNEILPGELAAPALVKIHPGEPKSVTGLLPELIKPQLRFLESKGIKPVIGDSTVIYTGGRNDRKNPPGNVSAYMKVVEHNRWSIRHTGVPFVIIDRPCTSIRGVFEFNREEVFREAASPGAYSGVFVSGGMEKANIILNNAHLTMHGLTPLALCVKGLAMGGASVRGKKQMHMNLTPSVNPETCKACGLCIRSCPFKALSEGEGGIPVLSDRKCAGCGECMAVCPHSALTMSHEGNVEWGRGTDSFLRRLADFTVSMMNGNWDKLVNVGHLYRITAQCDCMNKVQKPILGDIGIIVSKNPFAADMLAAKLFSEQALRENKAVGIKNYLESFSYIEETYRIRVKPEVISL